MRSILVAPCLALAGLGACRAADAPLLAEATELLGGVMFLDSGAPGMVLVVVRGDATLFRFYGETEKGNKHASDGASLLRVNSMTKRVYDGVARSSHLPLRPWRNRARAC